MKNKKETKEKKKAKKEPLDHEWWNHNPQKHPITGWSAYRKVYNKD